MPDVIDNTEELRKTLGVNIRRLRKASGKTQQELADEIKVSTVHLNRIEQGHTMASAAVLFALADAFNVPADTLRQIPVGAA